MSDPQTILARCRALGVIVQPEGDRLAIRPARLVPSDLLADIRAQKPALLAALRDDSATLLPDQAAWIPTARQIVSGEFDNGDRSLLESLFIGVRSIPHPACQQARARLEILLGKTREAKR